MGLPDPLHEPGDSVWIGDDVPGVVDRLIYTRNCRVPIYLVEWWDRGEIKCREFYEADVRKRTPDD
mgnify:CR=1 FL=1